MRPERPWPRRSSRTTVKCGSSRAATSSQDCRFAPTPCTSVTCGPWPETTWWMKGLAISPGMGLPDDAKRRSVTQEREARLGLRGRNDDTARIADRARPSDLARSHHREAARGDHGAALQAGPAPGRARPVRADRGEPQLGARGAAPSRGRGAGRAARQPRPVRRLDHGRTRRGRSTRCAPRSSRKWRGCSRRARPRTTSRRCPATLAALERASRSRVIADYVRALDAFFDTLIGGTRNEVAVRIVRTLAGAHQLPPGHHDRPGRGRAAARDDQADAATSPIARAGATARRSTGSAAASSSGRRPSPSRC